MLRKLSKINRPYEIGFSDMLKLMQQCSQVEKARDIPKRRAEGLAAFYEANSEFKDGEKDVQGDAPSHQDENDKKGILAGNPFSFFSGVFPGKFFLYLLIQVLS